MCDPLTAVLGVAGMAASALFGGSKKAAAPPAPSIAQAPQQVVAKQPTVAVGTDTDKDLASAKGGKAFTAKRTAGLSLGGLGKSDTPLQL